LALRGLAYAFSERLLLHKTEPAAVYLSFKQADQQEMSCNNQDGRLSKLMIDDDDGYVESLTLVYVSVTTVRCPGAISAELLTNSTSQQGRQQLHWLNRSIQTGVKIECQTRSLLPL